MRTLPGLDMKRIGIVFILFCVCIPGAYPQQGGIVEGRLINLTDSSITAPGAEIEVIELGAGMSTIMSAASDSAGKFRITGLPVERTLMIRATYKGVNYHHRLSFTAGRAVAEIGVYEPTASLKDIDVEGMQMAFQLTGDQLRSLETLTINNRTNPPRVYLNPEGTYRFSKAPGILQPPEMRVSAPGSSMMPLVQSALESADGRSYYTLSPLRPGVTKIEVQQFLPYPEGRYTYLKRFYQDVKSLNIGVIPLDMALTGVGLSKIETDSERNFAVYASTPITAGAEVTWEFSGGTPVAEQEAAGETREAEVRPMPNAVGRNALVIGPLLLMGMILVLWYSVNRSRAAHNR